LGAHRRRFSRPHLRARLGTRLWTVLWARLGAVLRAGLRAVLLTHSLWGTVLLLGSCKPSALPGDGDRCPAED
jgi:hypothetical protein